MRHLLQSVDRLAASGSSSGVVHTDTFLILAAVLCFLFCVVGLAFVARCWRLCNPSAYSVDAQEPESSSSSAIMPPSKKGLKKKALQALPTVLLGGKEEREEEDRPECAICLAEFARGDEVRVLPALRPPLPRRLRRRLAPLQLHLPIMPPRPRRRHARRQGSHAGGIHRPRRRRARTPAGRPCRSPVTRRACSRATANPPFLVHTRALVKSPPPPPLLVLSLLHTQSR
ncbi:hypothetical protein PR202_ga16601 [Eleusine coracana subsp. coracana]|uniref:Uncharacterized protein n=1 Tax=Eleusine coracana subsp. coracana TaxID=191504 RepID=A0AAV5CMB1_ELECO|nr:hypothetical protein PR202_ga16601 [Eleusine coracana subsp. coracana]